MRLLNTATLELHEFQDDKIPPYTIASHRWTDDETLYKDVKKSRNTGSKGYQKVQGFCNFLQTRPDNDFRIAYSWLWIDTACIDKSSSAELSKSINSMYEWYSLASICFVYLYDVQSLDEGFDTSDWFKRGWTLQELLAPRNVVFLSRDWKVLGHKCHVQHDTRCSPGHDIYGPSPPSV